MYITIYMPGDQLEWRSRSVC